VQSSLFPTPALQIVEDDQAGVRLVPGFLDWTRASTLFDVLVAQVDWVSSSRQMYDRTVDVPRLTASFALDAPVLPDGLRSVADEVTAALGTPFNAVGLNYYRDGRDSVAPHNDRLHDLVAPHPIALVSLGVTRRMVVQAKAPPRRAMHIDLEAGSLLVMSHASQSTHVHGIPKRPGVPGARMSLAFRVRRRGGFSR